MKNRLPICGQLVEEFENALRTGQRPLLNDHLNRIAATERFSSLRQWLPLESLYRQKAGDPIPLRATKRIPEAFDRLVKLYTALDNPLEVQQYRELRPLTQPKKVLSKKPLSRMKPLF